MRKHSKPWRKYWSTLGAFSLVAGVVTPMIACTGVIGSGGNERTQGQGLCDPTARPTPASLRRLTATQYRSTLADLVAWATKDANAARAILAKSASLAALPDDRREPTPQDIHGSYRRLDQTLQDQQVQSYYYAATEIAAQLTSPQWINVVVGPCATDKSPSGPCLDAFIQRFGARALRRPPTQDEIAQMRAVYGSAQTGDPLAFADVIGVMLNAPQFLYQVEHGDAPVPNQPGTFTLSSWELASRLAYQLWDTMPDDELFTAAADGSILKDDVFRREVDRMLADPRARVTLDGFVRDWLKADDLSPLDLRNTDPLFIAFAGANLPSKTLRDEVIADAVDTVDYFMWTKPSGMKELLTSDVAVNKGPELAKIYGVPAWNGQGAPPSFAAGQRPGLFTRALFLASGSANTRPIQKGVFLRRHILCDEIGTPPAGANAKLPELRPDLTTREVVEQLTQVDGTVCAGCHKPIINPLGFATEGFDALGRFRTEQRLFDPMTGALVGSKPVRTDSIPQVKIGDTRASSGPSDLMQQIAESDKPSVCFARNFFRFTWARWEDDATDGCVIRSMGDALSKGSLIDVVKAAVLDARFKQRTFDGG